MVKEENEFVTDEGIKDYKDHNQVSAEKFCSVRSLELSLAFICTGYTFERASRFGKTVASKKAVMENMFLETFISRIKGNVVLTVSEG